MEKKGSEREILCNKEIIGGIDEDFGRVTNHKTGRQEIGGRNLIGKLI